MPIDWSKYTTGLDCRPSATLEEIHKVEQALQVTFPEQYVDFLLQYNGGTGPVGPKGNSYIAFYPVDELIEAMEGYQVAEHAPGYLLFASDEGGTAYVFDTRQAHYPIFQVEFIVMGLEDAAFCGNSFQEFLETLYNEKPYDWSPYTCNMEVGSPATEEAIQGVEETLNVSFADDYKDFLLTHNGTRGYIGSKKPAYLWIWPIERVLSWMEESHAKEKIPGYIAFASDDQGNILIFDTDEIDFQQVYRLSATSFKLDEAVRQGVNFHSFLTSLL